MTKPIGLLLDTIHDNTGDKAARIAVERFLLSRRVEYEVLNPEGFRSRDYSAIIVGGGQLIRSHEDSFYDAFRVRGQHILNAVGLTTDEDLGYLQDYAYVSVRSEADRLKLASVKTEIAVTPCIAMATKARNPGVAVRAGAMGIHLSPDAWPACDGIEEVLNHAADYHKLLLPMTHYWHDSERFTRLSQGVKHASVAPYLEPEETCGLVTKLRVLVSASLHGCMFAYFHNIPFLAFQRKDPKVAAFMTDRGLERWLFANTAELQSKLDEIQAAPPDYSELIAADQKRIDTHLERMIEIVKSKTKVSFKGSPLGFDAFERLQEQVRARDFQLAKMRVSTCRDGDNTETGDFYVLSLEDSVREKEARLTAARKEADALRRLVAELRSNLRQARNELNGLDAKLAAEEVEALVGSEALQELEQLRRRPGFQLLESVRRLIAILAPWQTWRGKALDKLARKLVKGLDAAQRILRSRRRR